MVSMKKLLAFLSLFSLSFLSFAESIAFPDPFGLRWGMSEAALVKAGFTAPWANR